MTTEANLKHQGSISITLGQSNALAEKKNGLTHFPSNAYKTITRTALHALEVKAIKKNLV